MHTSYDPVTNQETSLLRYEKWRDGGLVATGLQRFRLQYWTLPEFGRMLTDAGFRRRYGNRRLPGRPAARTPRLRLDLPRGPAALTRPD